MYFWRECVRLEYGTYFRTILDMLTTFCPSLPPPKKLADYIKYTVTRPTTQPP